MAVRRLTSLSKKEFKKFIDSIDVVLSDCDGVLWRETEVIDGSPETVKKLKEIGKQFFYVTNNNSKVRSECVEKCKSLNYNTTVDEVVCTAFLVAMYLKEKGFNKKVYLIGNHAIAKELDSAGIKYIGIGPDPIQTDELSTVKNFIPDPDVGAVVVGFDKDFSYVKLMKAATYLQNPDVYFIGTNPDIDRPSPNKNCFPGAGCFIRIVELASFRKATILGKPEPFISEYIMKQYNLNPMRTLMIGDNRSTDILLGKRCGFKTLLVLSGVTSQADVDAMEVTDNKNVQAPDYYSDKLSDLLNMISDAS